MRWTIFLFLIARLCAAQTLAETIENVLDNAPGARRGFWGIQVVSLDTGATLYQSNADRLFVPASNAKLVTTALALTRLGADYRFQTVIRGEAPNAQGRIAGPLYLVGGGDPTLSARAVPYQKGPAVGDPLQAIEALADQLSALGVRSISGDVIGDDSRYVWEPYPDGWAQDDTVWDYGAPVSALSLNDNIITLTVRALRPGMPVITLSPPLDYYSIDNRVRAAPGAEGRVLLERLPGSRQVRLWGTLPNGAISMLVAVDDPALYAASALSDALTRRGIRVDGNPVARHRYVNQPAPFPAPPGIDLARRNSPPLVETLRIIDKVSQNLHAEMVLREAGLRTQPAGTRKAGLDEVRSFLTTFAGIPENDFSFVDASGLSRQDLVTPGALVKLLRAMYASPNRDAWVSLLPLGGTDGTLASRFNGNPDGHRVHAKTGSLDHVVALSGYIDSRTHGMLAFSILVNNFNCPGSEVRAAVDRIALALAK